MKMKTQIKRKAKRTLSLLLTAMLVISTMVVGLSVVNAATMKKIYFVNNSNTNWSTVNAYCWTDGKGSNADWPGKSMTKEAFHIADYGNADIYSYEVDTDSFNNVIFNNGSGGSGQTVDLVLTADKNIFVPSSSTGDNGKRMGTWASYSELAPVAKTVTLTPTTQSIVKGQSATITATLTEKADTDITLTLTGTDNSTQIATVKGTDTTADFTVTPTQDTTYTVTASADNYDSVKSGNATVTVTVPKTYYLWTSTTSNVTDTEMWTGTELTYADGSYTANVVFPSNGQNYFFAINESSTTPNTASVWSSNADIKDNVSTSETGFTSAIDAQENNNVYICRLAFQKANTDVKFTFTPSKTVVLSRNTTEPTTAPVTEPSTAPVTEPSTAPVTEPSTAPVTEPTTTPVTEPSTAPVTEPTTAPSTDTWYLKGSFNSWGSTNPFRGSDNVLTTNVFIDSSTVQTLKVWNSNDDKYYGSTVINPSVATEINDLQLGYYIGGGETRNVKFQPTQTGIYKFTFNPTTCRLSAELVASSVLNAEISAPESVKAGEIFSVTAKAIPGSEITPASYKFTIKIDGKTVVNGVSSNTEQYTYNKASISTPSEISAYVEAYDADGNIIGVSSTVEKKVEVTYDELTVKISANSSEVAKDTVVTFKATADPVSYVSSYDFYISKSFDFEDAEPISQQLSTLMYTFSETGTYYIKVVARNKYSSVVNAALDGTSNIIQVNVFETVGEHEVTFYFKAPSAFAYKPKMVLDGTALAVERDAELGASFSGSVTFYWFKATATVDSSKEHTLTVSTLRTNASGSIIGNCYGNEYWFGIDNLMSGKTLANLTSLQEYIRNYYHSPLHTVYAGKADDGTLGFTNIGGVRYAMGTYSEGDPSQRNDAVMSVKAATAAQKSVSKLDTYSEVQTCLLDVNLDGKVDVKDATMIQKALVKLI